MTKVTNKHLLPVYNKPMIYYPIDTLKKSGVTELLIITGTESAGDFMKLLGSGDELGVHITFRVQEGTAGIADALKLAENFVGNENFAVILGDNIYEENFKTIIQNFTNGAHIFLQEVEYADRFGVATLNEKNEVITIVEKPHTPETNFAVTGLYVYDSSVFKKLEIVELSNRGEYEITDVNQMYIDDSQMTASFLEKGWNDAGTHESLFYASKLARAMALEAQ
ncbi:TPA: spore coat protein [Candidatus Peregrinibacteria bacterium]|nr:spore coat protein [Candidatus Peregrinibacteria bacterium]